MRIAVECQLTGYALRQRTIELARSRRQHRLDVLALGVVALERCKLLVLSKHVVQLLDQDTHSGDELYQTFGDQYRTEVQTGVGAVNDYFYYLLNDIVQRHVLGFNLL